MSLATASAETAHQLKATLDIPPDTADAPKRRRRGMSPLAEPMWVFRNSSRKSVISIGAKSAVPMGCLYLTEREAKRPVVQQYRQRGQLQFMGVKKAGPEMEGHLLFEFYNSSPDRVQSGGKIVISRNYATGDILITTAFIRSLAVAYPDVPVVFATPGGFSDLVMFNPYVQVVTDRDSLFQEVQASALYLPLDDVMEQYEYNSDFDVRLNRIEILCDYANIEPVTLCPEYYMLPSEIKMGSRVVKPYPKPYIGISPSSARVEKTWRAERWRELAIKLASSTGGTVFIFDKEPVVQCDNPKVVEVAGMDFRYCGAVGWYMDVFLTQDSLWMHWAAALGVPQVLLASCTDGLLATKGYPDMTVIQHRNWSCCPCWYDFRKGGCSPKEHPRCLDDVSVADLYDVVLDKLNGLGYN